MRDGGGGGSTDEDNQEEGAVAAIEAENRRVLNARLDRAGENKEVTHRTSSLDRVTMGLFATPCAQRPTYLASMRVADTRLVNNNLKTVSPFSLMSVSRDAEIRH